MKLLPSIPLLLLCSISGYAQNKNLDSKYAVRLYNTTSWEKKTEPYYMGSFTGRTTHEQFQFLHPSISFRAKNKRNNFHELELYSLRLDEREEVSTINTNFGPITMAGGKITTTNIAVRYEYTINFMKKKNSRLMPAIGIAAMPYFERTDFDPVLSTQYPTSQIYAGVRGFIIPKLTYAVGSRMFLDLSIPLCFADTYFDRTKQKNPILPHAEQQTDVFNFEAAPQFYSVRVGLGLKI
jgi:hypothetical protein